MLRRRRALPHENAERWMVSYADFITLLFAFFVVMYSISSVNEGKYKALSESLSGAFSDPPKSPVPIPVGDPITRVPPLQAGDLAAPAGTGTGTDSAFVQIQTQLEQAFGDLIKTSGVKVRGNELWVEIEMSSSLLFPSGDAIPSNKAFEVIDKVAGILAPYKNPIKVEGFTDNQPINTALYPSNWELSAARAASIVQLLIAGGVAPNRLAAVGYGEYQPVADNGTAEGRSSNRRVVLVISRFLDVRNSGDKAQQPGLKPSASLETPRGKQGR